MLKNLFVNTLLSIFIISSTSYSFANPEDFTSDEGDNGKKLASLPKLPLQNTQISACLNFAQSPDDANYQALQRISQNNLQHIESLILSRFGDQSENYKKFIEISGKCQEMFSNKEASLKELAKFHFRLVTIADPKANQKKRYIDAHLEEIEENFLQPIPVISQRGLGSIAKLSDLISSGFYYFGLPLTEDVEFDGEKSHPQRFSAHELFHAGYLTVSPEITFKTFEFLKRLDRDFERLALTPADKELIQIVRFRAYHETTNTLLFTLLAESSQQNPREPLSYQEYAVRILNEGKVHPKRGGGNEAGYIFCKDFAPYAESKNIIKFPEEIDSEKKISLFANEFNNKINNLISLFSLDGKWNGLARDKIQSEMIPSLQSLVLAKKLSQEETLDVTNLFTPLYPYQWSILKNYIEPLVHSSLGRVEVLELAKEKSSLLLKDIRSQ